MFGDFSRDSFDSCKNYKRVLMQQGRPLTDADWNEQVSLIWDQLESLTRIAIGWHGTAKSGDGFKIMHSGSDFVLSVGEYLVDGLKCDNRNPKNTLTPIRDLTGSRVVYLDVWEQSVNAIEDPSLLEPALRGIDTATRSRIMWALKYMTSPFEKQEPDPNPDPNNPGRTITVLRNPNSERQLFLQTVRGEEANSQQGRLKARLSPASPATPATSPCAIPNSSVGFGDRLYRVEIHRCGKPLDKTDGSNELETAATFKWSRTNGSIVIPLGRQKPSGNILNIDQTAFMPQLEAQVDTWGEMFDLEGRSVNKDRQLVRIKELSAQQVKLDQAVAVDYAPGNCLAASYNLTTSNGYYLRQWEQSEGKPFSSDLEKAGDRIVAHRIPAASAIRDPSGSLAVVVVTEPNDYAWLELEAGLEVQFSGNCFHQGDYWLIRTTSTGNVIVLPDGGENCEVAPRGTHRYAPIGRVSVGPVYDNNYRKDFEGPGVQYPNALPNDCQPCKPIDTQPNNQPADATVPRNRPAVTPSCCGVAASPASLLLSSEGEQVLKGFFGSACDITRRIPARYLKNDPVSEAYRRFRSPLLISDILEPSFEKYLAKVDRCIEVDDADRSLLEADAKADYTLANEFQSRVTTGQARRSPIA